MKKLIALIILTLVSFCLLASCNGCGGEHTHDFGERKISKAPTCTEEGAEVRYCDCGENQTEVISALGHTPGETVIEDKVDATYDADGSYKSVVYCTTCNGKISEKTHTLPMLKHTPAEAVEENRIEATCYSEGSYDTVVYCTDCGEELERAKHTIPMVEHTPATAIEENLKDSTCYAEGNKDLVVYCSVAECHKELSRNTEIIGKKTHAPAAAVEENIVDSTCYSVGSKDMVVYCSVPECHAFIEKSSVTIDKKAHTPDSAVEENRVNPTYEKDGSYQMVVYCSVAACHAELERTTHNLDMLVHHPGTAAIENEVAATCTENGSYDEVVYCLDADCGHKELSRKTIITDMIPHSGGAAVEENRLDATCYSEGSYDSVVYCSVCNTELSRNKVTLQKIAHAPADAVVENLVNATCYGEGSYDSVVYCSICSAELSRNTVTLQKIAHTPADAVVENLVNATCTANGSYDEVVYCSVEECKVQISRTTKLIEASGHLFGDWVTIKEATRTEEGVKERYCTCGEKKTETIAKVSHSVGLKFTLNSDGNSYSVTGIGTCTDTDIIIPTTYNGKPVTSIGGIAFYNCTGLTSIVIPDSVTSIGARAFLGCTGLTSIVLPDSVTSIGSSAFSSCTGLTSVVIPDSVTSIGNHAFSGCTGLTSIEIPDRVTSIEDSTFYSCTSLINVVIGDCVTSIERYAFYNCTGLINVVIGDSVTEIGYEAFYYCTSLLSVTLPEGLVSIGDHAFSGCFRLVEVVNNSSLNIVSLPKMDIPGLYIQPYEYGSIGQYAIEVHTGESRLNRINEYYFYTTYNAVHYLVAYVGEDTDLVFPETCFGDNYVINQYAFYETNITSVVMPNSVTRIDNNAFSHCTALASMVMSDNITAIDNYAFNSCSSLASIVIPSSVMKIGFGVFRYCDNLSFNMFDSDYYLGNDNNPYHALISAGSFKESYVVHEDTVVIASNAFSGLKNIVTITIPDSVKVIGANAFKDARISDLYISDLTKWCEIEFGNENSVPTSKNYYETSLYLNGDLVTDLVIPEQVTKISSYAFYGFCSLKSITISKNVAEIGEWVFAHTPYVEVIHYNAVLAKFVGKDHYPFAEYRTQHATLNIGSDVAEIPAYMFAEARIKSVIFAEDSVCTKISSGAFSNCSLTTFTPSRGILEIEAGAFDGSSGVLIKYGNAQYLETTTNSHYALIKVLNQDVRSCVIHKNTRLIANAAFEGCELMVEITVPDKVLYLGADAFKDCVRLQSVVLSENLVRIGENAFAACPIVSAEFKNTNSWKAGANGIAPDTLKNTESAAATLITYCDLAWMCSIVPEADSDLDGLFDDEELELGTDPDNYDTDGDGICDSDEIGMGLDPFDSDLDNYSRVEITNPEILDTKATPDTVKPIINVRIESEYANLLVIKRTDLFNESAPGYIGDAYSYSLSYYQGSDSYSVSFGSATIGFEFDPSKLSADAEPTIYSYSQYSGKLVPLSTTINGNRATTVVTSFSTYVLLDRKVLEEQLSWKDTWMLETDFYSTVEVVFVIDDSGSMADNDPNNLRLTVAQGLIDKLPVECKIGIVKFNGSVTMLTSSLVTNKTTAKKYLTTSYFKSSGNTEIYKSVNSATSLFSTPKTGDGVMRIMIVLSDGEPTSTSHKETCVESAKAKSIAIYTVGLGGGSSNFLEHLKPLSDKTDGKFLYSSNADVLLSVFDDLGDKIDFSVDSDDDGIPDYYEDNMVAFGGYSFKLNKYKADTDGDGLLDGEEIEITFMYSSDGTQVTIMGQVISNPELKDSDWDGYSDPIDKWPLNSKYH